MTYSLQRERDGAGDSGNMSTLLTPTFDMDTGKIVDVEYTADARPQLGGVMRVGSHYARSYQAQDWWQTTIITEILEDTPECVKFKTGNSTYEWKVF